MKFTALLELGGKTATGIRVPPEVVAALGPSKRPAVQVTLNGYTYRSTVAVMGGVFLLPVSAEVRAHAHIAAGDTVDVDVEVDTEPRTVEVPADLAQALAADDTARQFFESLSYSNQRRLVLAIEGAKAAETRQRRVASTVAGLHAGKA